MSELRLTLRQPAQVGDKARSDNVLGTQDFLPGTAVRGAFAAAWIARRGAPEPGSSGRAEFLRLFEGGVRYGALLLAGAQPVPLSVVAHRYERTERCPETEYDRATTSDVPMRCPECGSPLEHPRTPPGNTPTVNRRTSVAIASSGVALRGQLVTRDVLASGQSFSGTLIASEPGLAGVLADLGQVRIGGRRTTHGTADVHLDASAEPPTAERRSDGSLIIRLRSDGIFVDDYGRPTLDPNPADLETVLGCPARIAGRWARWHTAGGWHIASGLPKPVELTAAAGSTYLIETSAPVADAALAQLGQTGLGLRRHEGFGDLAPPPVLAPGLQARTAEAERQRKLTDRAFPLRGLQVRPEEWKELLALLAAHIAGDQSATASLCRKVGQLDQRPAQALDEILGLAPGDAGYVLQELGRS